LAIMPKRKNVRIFEKKKSMRIALNNAIIDKYFSFLTRLDNSSKKRLIIKLTESIETNEQSSFDLKDLFGAWEDTRSTEEIISGIRSSRVEKNNSIDL